jgi:hypothetical protein
VVERGGRFYLFRTQDYGRAITHVFASDDPAEFGVGDARAHFVAQLAVAAPELIVDADGTEYITSNHDLRGGTRMARLGWRREG